jgi:signal transduction histidine kinase
MLKSPMTMQDDTATTAKPDPANAGSAPATAGPAQPTRLGLSGKLLMLTILFVMLAQVLIYVPLISNFRLNWLNDRLAAAHTAALVLDAAPSGMVPDTLARQILNSVGARAVAMKMGTQRRLLAVSDMPPEVHHEIDMRDVSRYRAIVDAFRTLLCADNDAIRVVGPAPRGGDFVEIVLDEAPLRQAMLRFSTNILLISLLISGITAILVYASLHYLFVRPMRRVTANMMAFRADPENPVRVIATSRRRDEIGLAERELASMQVDLASMLQQKSRLASLGLAVSKINHDLRNLLTSAQLFSEGLAHLPDPRVQRFAPKLMRALERAIAFCESTLSYGRAQEPPPDRRPVELEPIVEEVRDTLQLADSRIGWITAIERGLMVDADADQLLRVILNLSRNAVQALETKAPNDPARDQVRITGRREGAVVVIEVSDTGPGFPDRAKERLFQPFQSSARSGGTGLGLVIAGELVRAHGGDIALVEGTIGATFRLTIPDRAVDLEAHRPARARA